MLQGLQEVHAGGVVTVVGLVGLEQLVVHPIVLAEDCVIVLGGLEPSVFDEEVVELDCCHSSLDLQLTYMRNRLVDHLPRLNLRGYSSNDAIKNQLALILGELAI